MATPGVEPLRAAQVRRRAGKEDRKMKTYPTLSPAGVAELSRTDARCNYFHGAASEPLWTEVVRIDADGGRRMRSLPSAQADRAILTCDAEGTDRPAAIACWIAAGPHTIDPDSEERARRKIATRSNATITEPHPWD